MMHVSEWLQYVDLIDEYQLSAFSSDTHLVEIAHALIEQYIRENLAEGETPKRLRLTDVHEWLRSERLEIQYSWVEYMEEQKSPNLSRIRNALEVMSSTQLKERLNDLLEQK